MPLLFNPAAPAQAIYSFWRRPDKLQAEAGSARLAARYDLRAFAE
jgi:hypothetical protein